MSRRRVAALLALSVAAGPAGAQFGAGPADSEPKVAGTPTDAQVAVLKDVGIEEQLGKKIPLDLEFLDQNGAPYRLGRAFDGTHPVVLTLVYYKCPMLCGLILSGVAKAMRQNGLELGKDYHAVTVSFDPSETPALAAEHRRGYVETMGLLDTSPEWPFLVGTARATRALADSVGFHYAKDPASGEWAHIAAIFILTPDGKVSRYLYGIDYPPKDFRLAIAEAAGGKVGTAFDRLLLTCYRYDPASRKYTPYAWAFVRIGAGLVLVALTGVIGALVWRERRSKRRASA